MEMLFLRKCPVTGVCDYGNECSGFLTVGTSWISIVALTVFQVLTLV